MSREWIQPKTPLRHSADFAKKGVFFWGGAVPLNGVRKGGGGGKGRGLAVWHNRQVPISKQEVKFWLRVLWGVCEKRRKKETRNPQRHLFAHRRQPAHHVGAVFLSFPPHPPKTIHFKTQQWGNQASPFKGGTLSPIIPSQAWEKQAVPKIRELR